MYGEKIDKVNAKATKTVLIMAVTAAFGSLAFGYDTGVINGALPYMARPDQLNLTPAMEGLVGSTICLGAACGSVLGGRLADILGRKPTLTYLSIVFFLSTLGCTFSVNSIMMICFRFFLGIGVGGAAVTVPAYLAEIATGNLRGRLVVMMELFIVSGQFLAYVVNAVIAVTLGHDPNVWRYILAMAAIPALLLFFGMMLNKESPRWLLSKGRASEALHVLKLTNHTEAKAIAELNDIQDLLNRQSSQKEFKFKELTERWMKKVLVIGIVLAVISQFTGVNSIMYYGSQILTTAGFSTDAALIGNVGNGVISVVGTCIGFYLIRKIGRKTMYTVGLTGIFFSNSLIGIVSSALEGDPILPYLVLCLTVTFLAFQQTFLSPATWVMMSEMFPLKMRGTAMGIAVFCLWIANFFVTCMFPILVDTVGLSSTFFIFSGVVFLSIVFVRLYMPETKGLSIEDIERKFRREYSK